MNKEKFQTWHDKNYKKLLLIPIIIIAACLVYMFVFYSQHSSLFLKDVSLTGGTSVTLYGKFDKNEIVSNLEDKLEDINTREVYDVITREQKAIIIETKSDETLTRDVLENYLGYELNDSNSSFEFTGSSLSESFLKQLILAVIFAFVFMAIVVFVLFRTFVPSMAVIVSAFADILMTLTFVDVLGFKMSTAGIVALLMLIGYSVDTDILLTNRVLKREGSVNSKIFGAFKTGITMTLTSFVAIGLALLITRTFSIVLAQILTILVIGLLFDILNTWITNVSIIKWYALKKQNEN